MRVSSPLFCAAALLWIVAFPPVSAQAQNVQTVVAASTAAASDSASINVNVNVSGDENQNGHTMVAFREGTLPYVIVGFFPGTAAFRSVRITGLTPGLTHDIRLTHIDPDGVAGNPEENIGPIQLAPGQASNLVTAGPVAVIAGINELIVAAPLAGDANRNSIRNIFVGASPTGPWAPKAAIALPELRYARLRSLDSSTDRYVRVIYTDADGVTGTADQVVGPIFYSTARNLALGKTFTADTGTGVGATAAILGSGSVQPASEALTYNFAQTGTGLKQATVDLGASASITSVAVFLGNAASIPTNWTIQTSNNGTTWTNAVAQTNSTRCVAAGAFEPPTLSWNWPSCALEASFNPVFARYVRYSYDSSTMPFGPGGSLVQFEVYGSECTAVFNPTSMNVVAAGTSATIDVAIPTGCVWSATDDRDWITITAGGGNGNGSVNYTVAANPTQTARTGSISIGASTFAITQAALACAAVLTPTSATASASAGTGSVGVTIAPACGAWSSSSNAAWLTIGSGASGVGNGTLNYAYTANTTAATRTGTLTIGGASFTLTQEGLLCAYALSPDLAASAAGGPASIAVTTTAGCAWTAVSNAAWITLGTPSSGSGAGSVPITVAANAGATARIGTVRVGGRTFTVTQARQACSYAISPSSATVRASGDTGKVEVSAPAGCEWTAASRAPWLTITGAASGSGNGSFDYTASANASGAVRAGTIAVGSTAISRSFAVTQASDAQGLACNVNAGVPPVIRAQGIVELAGDILVVCSGNVPQGGTTLDVALTLNTNITSKLLPAGDRSTEAMLLVNEPTSPVLNTTAFAGTLTGYNSLLFSNIPLAAGAVNPTFRITNVRVNANLVSSRVSPAVVNGLVEVKSARLVTMQNASATIAFLSDTMSMSAGAIGDGPALNVPAIPVSFTEQFSNAFKIRLASNQSPSQPGTVYNTESGFVNNALGATVGLADTGTRIRMVLAGVPTGARVYVPLRPVSGIGARLLSEDTVVATGSHYGGTYQEVPVQGGVATATWEIDVANAAQIERHIFAVAFSGATTPQLEAVRTSITGTLAPLSGVQLASASVVPRFFDPAAPQSRVNLRITANPVVPVAAGGLQLVRAKALPRLVVGSNYAFSYQLNNDSTDQATNVVVRGNLPPGFNVGTCSGGTGSQCASSNNDFAVTYANIPAGGSATINVTAAPTVDLEPGYFVESTVSASADQLDTDLASNRDSNGVVVADCPAVTPNSASVPAAGGTFTIAIPACVLWTSVSQADWITVTAGATGTGAGQVTYQVQANTGAARSGTIFVAGGQLYTVNQAAAPPAACTYSLASSAASIPATGTTGNATVALTATGTNCAWTAASNAAWAQVFPLSGTGSGTIFYRVFPNFRTSGRSATLTVGGQSFQINQATALGTPMQRFVRLAYFSFLGRVPTDAEVDVHANSGLPQSVIAANFWNSDEFAFGGRLIAGVYVGLLERDAEYGGWQFQRLALADGGINQSALLVNFLNSAEFVSRNGSLDDAAFVNFLYTRVLGRTPSPAEAAGQVANLQGGLSRADLATFFLSSGEFRLKATARLDAFLLYATLLLRDGSSAERENIRQQLAVQGAQVNSLIDGFVQSAEFGTLLQ